MFGRFWNIVVVGIYLLNIFHSISAGSRVGFLIQCRDQILNLNYNPALPAAANGTVTRNVEDNGNWQRCQVRKTTGLSIEIVTPVQYFASMTLSQANCERANFTKLEMIGNFNLTLSVPAMVFNFTIKLSDPTHSRPLNVPQKFDGLVTLPIGVDTPLTGNFTYKFPAVKHQSGCQAILNEQVLVDADLNLLYIDN